jgi:hypothetical protein
MGFLLGGKKVKTQITAAAGVDFQNSCYGKPVPIIYGTTRTAPNLIWYGDFQAIAQQSSSGAGGKGGVGGGGGGKGGGGSTSYIYRTSVQMALCEGPIVDVPNAYVDKNIVTPASLGFSTFLGTYPQAAWSYLTTNHPGEALGYNGFAHLDASAYDLGNSPQLPNHNFEVQGIYSNSLSSLGKVDADPSLIVPDLLSNEHYGSGFPSDRVGSLATWQAYCIANGLWISPSYIQQSTMATILDDIAIATNSAVIWSEGVLSIIPYGDQSITANGYTYSAPSSPLYDLTDDDFQSTSGPSGSGDPIQVTRSRPADAFNSLKLEYLDRNQSYNTAIVEAKDQAQIDQYGLRQDNTRSFHLFCDSTAAQQSIQLQLQRQFLRNKYVFTLDSRYAVLDTMDIVSITNAALRLDRKWVRIIQIDENDDYSLTFTCEDYLQGTGSAAAYSFQGQNGYNADYNESAGDVNDPVIFEPPVQITDTGLEMWFGVSGGTNWGGADVYISSDDTTYALAGRIVGPSRQGVLYADLPTSLTNPDEVNTLSVNLSESNGQLLSGTQADADNLVTLCYVDGELIAYETATLTGTNQYNLTYLQRGAYGTPVTSHANTTKFLRLDDGVFTLGYNKSQIGQTIYIKFLSYNIFGGGFQALSDVDPYTYTLVGPPAPTQVQNFQVTQNGIPVVFQWDDLEPNDVGIKGYDIKYGPIGSDWDSKFFLTEANRGTEMTNADVPPGPWEFSIRAHDIADQLGPESVIEFTVVNDNDLVIDEVSEPGWVGTCSGFVPHPNGKLVPDNIYPMSHYTTYDPFDIFVPDPVSSAYYITPTQDIGYDDNLRVYSTSASALGPGETGAAATLGFSIDHWLDGGSDPNTYTSWVSDYVEFRYIKGKITYTGISAGNVSYLTDFTLFADVTNAIQQSGSLSVAPGGSTLTFPRPYHTPPYVTATPITGTALYATCVSVTDTTCVIHVWDSTGTDVGGTVNWTSSGT